MANKNATTCDVCGEVIQTVEYPPYNELTKTYPDPIVEGGPVFNAYDGNKTHNVCEGCVRKAATTDDMIKYIKENLQVK